MTRHVAPRPASPTRHALVAGLALVALLWLAGCRPADDSATTGGSAVHVASTSAPLPPGGAIPRDEVLQDGGDGAIGVADGKLPSGATISDTQYPGVAKLDRGLGSALDAATDDAASDGVDLWITSGWRSRAYQEQLFQQAVAKYGSESEAAQWVARPGTSVHEAGDAVDVGPDPAVAWLSENGTTYGLCQIYRNEPWHFELRPEAASTGCPAMYADPSADPRLRR